MTDLFGPNNHSKWQISWNAISNVQKRELTKLFLDHYDFDGVEGIKQVDEWERMSNNFRIWTHRKGKPIEVLLRKHINIQKKESALLIGGVISYLADEGIPVPVVIPTKSGDQIFSFDGHFYQLYNFIPGDHFRGTKEELTTVAQVIAHLHQKLAAVPFVEEIRSRQYPLTQWSKEEWDRIFEIAEERGDQYDAIVLAERDTILAEIEKVEQGRNVLGKASVQVVRNSLHPQDTLFEDGKLKAIIDFEEVGFNQLARDVGGACHRFARQFVVHQEQDWRETLPEGVTIFMKEYIDKNPLNKTDMQSIPLLLSDELLRKVFSDVSKYYFQGSAKKIEGGELEKKLLLLNEVPIVAKEIEKINT